MYYHSVHLCVRTWSLEQTERYVYTCGNGKRGRERLQSEVMGGPDLPWMFLSLPNPNCIWDSGTCSSYNVKSPNGPRISPRSSSPTSSWSEDRLVTASVACFGSVSRGKWNILLFLVGKGTLLPASLGPYMQTSLLLIITITDQFQKSDASVSFLLFITFVSFFRKDLLPFMWQQNMGSSK